MLRDRIKNVKGFKPAEVTGSIPSGDMPGDKVQINESHITKATVIFPELLGKLELVEGDKAVVTVFGGSGVGKSEIASLLAYYLNSAGIGTYVLSGDNYPFRIPLYNDAERASIFRAEALKGLLKEKKYSSDNQKVLNELWANETDSDPKMCEQYPWLKEYQKAGRKALAGYLGTDREQDFGQLNDIIAQFKSGSEKIFLKRMGRSEDARWYDEVDFSNIQVLVIEWTHGGNEKLNGVDVRVLLNSTPEETREHRRLRARDGKTDSAFTTMVLEIEQTLLDSQAPKADIIISKSAELMNPEDFKR